MYSLNIEIGTRCLSSRVIIKKLHHMFSVQSTTRQFLSWRVPIRACAIACLKWRGLKIPLHNCFCINVMNGKVYSIVLEAKTQVRSLYFMLSQTFYCSRKNQEAKDLHSNHGKSWLLF